MSKHKSRFHGMNDRQIERITSDFRTGYIIIRDKDTVLEQREVYLPGPMVGVLSADQGRRMAQYDYEGLYG